MKVQITQEHIDRAIRWRDEVEKSQGAWKEVVRNCPVHQALREVFPGEDFMVGVWDVYFPKASKTLRLDSHGQHYTKKFNQGWEELIPGEIEVEDV